MDIRRLQDRLAALQGSEADSVLREVGAFLLELTNGTAFCVFGKSHPSAALVPDLVLTRSNFSEETLRQAIPELQISAAQAFSSGEAVVLRPAAERSSTWLWVPRIPAEGTSGQVLGLSLDLAPTEAVESFLIIFQLACSVLGVRTVPRPGMAASGFQGQMIECWTEMMGNDDPRASQIPALVERLASLLGCSHVALATRSWNGARVAAISGASAWPARSPARQRILSAAQEALRSGACLDDRTPDAPAHAECARTLEHPVASLPLSENMALVLTGSMASSARDAAALERPLLRSMFVALHQKARAAFWHHLTPRVWWKNPRRRQRDLLLLLGILLLPLPHPVWLSATLEPDQRRVVASPFEATLAKSLVRPGDKVEAGQPLAQLDDREWAMRQTQAKAAHGRALKLRDQAMTRQDDDPATSLAMHLEAEEREMELRQVEWRLENLTLRAPVAGTVIEGDLDRMEGVPVRQGQTLFVIAPIHRMLVEMEIPQHRIAQIHEGRTVWVRISIQPWRLRALTVERLLPEAQIRDTRSLFVAQTALHLDPSRDEVLRPGMKGSAIVWCGVRPLGWILFQHPFLFLWNLGF